MKISLALAGILLLIGECLASLLQFEAPSTHSNATLVDGLDPICKFYDINCPFGQRCYQGVCYPDCRLRKCQDGYICNGVICQRNPNYCFNNG